MEHKIYETELAGRKLSFEFGRYAEQAAGSVLVRYGDTVVLVCATVADTPRPGIDFFPLGVDFEEKQYSVGKIPGGFIKREGRPTEKAILTSRLIDRPLRPLFPKGMRNDVSVVATVLSNDNDCSAEIPAMIGSSIALCVSEIPFAGPTGSVVVGLIDDEFVLNPTVEQREKSDLHLTVSGTKDAIMMVEAGAKEVSEEKMLQAILYAHEEIKKLVAFQEGIIAEIGKEKLKSMARSAAKLGIELFVLDDGWFGARNDDTCALGDWVVNEKKLGCTMKQLVDDIRAEGIEFGLWFEPEMISPDSDLYRAHPDWCLHQKKRAPSLGRHQLILDMTRKDVRDYVVDIVSSVLSSADIRYVKWDMNRNMAEVGSAQLPAERIGEIYHRYILGVYEVMERITSAFPDVLFESCSGGGGRFDAGILYYMPQNWTSDDSDAIQRLNIQYGCSMVYPPSVMTCHVSAVPNHQVGRITPLHTRANVAMQGSFGYELDMEKLTEEERREVAAQIVEYKKMRDIVITGSFYRLISPVSSNEYAFEQVSEDGRTVILTYVKKLNNPNPAVRRVRLKGLEANAQYVCEQTGLEVSGDTLMNAGVNLPDTRQDFDSVRWVFTRI